MTQTSMFLHIYMLVLIVLSNQQPEKSNISMRVISTKHRLPISFTHNCLDQFKDSE